MRLIALEKEEVLRLLEAAKRHGPRAHAMVLLAIRHGLRVSEVTGLRVEHVNVKEGWIRVERLKGSLTTVQTLERHPGQPQLEGARAQPVAAGTAGRQQRTLNESLAMSVFVYQANPSFHRLRTASPSSRLDTVVALD